jgi:hypothetical protein
MLPHERLSKVYDHALAVGIESLTNEERDLYLIQDFIIELEMGGLSGYFYNRLPLKNQIKAAVSAMRKYGLNELADLLSEAHQLFEDYSETDAAKTWTEILQRHDPRSRLAVIEKKIDAIQNYGVDGSSIT